MIRVTNTGRNCSSQASMDTACTGVNRLTCVKQSRAPSIILASIYNQTAGQLLLVSIWLGTWTASLIIIGLFAFPVCLVSTRLLYTQRSFLWELNYPTVVHAWMLPMFSILYSVVERMCRLIWPISLGCRPIYYDYEHDNHTWSSVFNRISLYILSALPVSTIDIQPSNDALKMMQIPHIGL